MCPSPKWQWVGARGLRVSRYELSKRPIPTSRTQSRMDCKVSRVLAGSCNPIMKASGLQDTRRLVWISCREAEAQLEVVGWVGVARESEYQE